MNDEKKESIPIEEIFRIIQKNPGINRADLIKKTGIPRGGVESRLASLENKNLFIYEDNYGGLYPFL